MLYPKGHAIPQRACYTPKGMLYPEGMIRIYAVSVLEVFTEANEKWMEQWKGEDGTGPALMRIMVPELCEANKQEIEEIEKGIHGAVDILQSPGPGRSEIKKAVMEQYNLTEKKQKIFV